ncbi:unnamed protein product [Pleuronectes platessa]|uniref:Uncharacterized protein n=1 Tax=Pleuronectes platessa TaxID=8262 RepID=A0A9N7VQX5_PLEPL|nr:unnamed protein product [Pleuronectes platessa]
MFAPGVREEAALCLDVCARGSSALPCQLLSALLEVSGGSCPLPRVVLTVLTFGGLLRSRPPFLPRSLSAGSLRWADCPEEPDCHRLTCWEEGGRGGAQDLRANEADPP